MTSRAARFFSSYLSSMFLGLTRKAGEHELLASQCYNVKVPSAGGSYSTDSGHSANPSRSRKNRMGNLGLIPILRNVSKVLHLATRGEDYHHPIACGTQ